MSSDQSFQVWSLSNGTQLGGYQGSNDAVFCACFIPNGSRIATGGRHQLIHIGDANTFDELVQLAGHTSYVKSLAWSPNGDTLVSGSGDHTVRLWRAPGH